MGGGVNTVDGLLTYVGVGGWGGGVDNVDGSLGVGLIALMAR